MKNVSNHIINILSIIVLIYFAIPKIIGLSVSKAGFEQFQSVLQIDADFFRIFTGFSELIIVLLILTYVVSKNDLIGKIAYLFLLITMLSALGIEFLVRPTPVVLLVSIAIILSLTSIYQIKNIYNHAKS